MLKNTSDEDNMVLYKFRKFLKYSKNVMGDKGPQGQMTILEKCLELKKFKLAKILVFEFGEGKQLK